MIVVVVVVVVGLGTSTVRSQCGRMRMRERGKGLGLPALVQWKEGTDVGRTFARIGLSASLRSWSGFFLHLCVRLRLFVE